MTKEDLIGRKFIVESSGETYDILRQVGYDIYYKNIRPEFSRTHQPISTFIEQFDKGHWKLIEEEPKMYNTPKGVEYGVGTQFEHGNVGAIYIIDKIEKDDIWISAVKNSTVKSQHWTKASFDSAIMDSKNTKVITLVLDYKQVDPKTIKFDFTNTKIKVNNEDESKWVRNVAVSNKYEISYLGTEYLFNSPCALYFSNNSIYRTNINDKYFNENKIYDKEITIQDILNNMKEVIEVGDTVEILHKQSSGLDVGQHYRVTSTRNRSIQIKKSPSSNEWHFDLDAVKLVSKGKKKEIIGYETVVDLPGIPKGTKSNFYNGKYIYAHTTTGVTLGAFNDEQVQDTKFFKPIYKQDAIELKFSKYTATLSKENGLVFSDGEKLSFKDVVDTLKALSKTIIKVDSKGGYDISFQFTVASVKVGCKSFTPDDVALVSNAIKELDK